MIDIAVCLLLHERSLIGKSRTQIGCAVALFPKRVNKSIMSNRYLVMTLVQGLSITAEAAIMCMKIHTMLVAKFYLYNSKGNATGCIDRLVHILSSG